MSATSIDLSQIKTDALSAASTFRTLIGLGTSDTPTFKAATLSAGTLNGTVLDIAQTWGGTGTYTGIRYNVTDSGPSNAASLLLDLQVGGTSRFSVRKTGGLQFLGSGDWELDASSASSSSVTVNIRGKGSTGGVALHGSYIQLSPTNIEYYASKLLFGSSIPIVWCTGNPSGTAANQDLQLWRDAANTLAQRNGTSAQTFRIYNTTDAGLNNYERAKIAWESNVLVIGTEAGGTGTRRSIKFPSTTSTGNTIAQFAGSNDGTVTISDAGSVVINADSVNGTNPLQIRYGGSTVINCSYAGNIDLNLANFGAGYGHITTSAGTATTKHLQLRSYNGINLDLGGLGGSGLKLLTFNGTTSSFPAIKRNSAALNFRLADDSADCDITAAKATLSATLDLTIRTVTYGATMAIDAALGNKIAITLAGNGTISNPTNAVDGRVLVFRLRQDATGSRIPVWDTKYAFVGDLATVTLSTAANKIDRVAFEYDSTDDKWYCISFIKGS